MKSTTRFRQNKRGIECLNCKQPISAKDNFCSNCGQVNDELPLSIKQFISEFFSGFFSFDTRFFNTFVPLLFKPAKVSKDYIKGKRRRYVNPFQLYLHVSIVFFLLQGLFSVIDGYKITDSNKKPKDSFMEGIEINLEESDSIANFDNQKIEKFIDSTFNARLILKQLNDSILTANQKDSVFDLIYKPTLSFISDSYNKNNSNSWEKKMQLLELKQDAIEHLKTVLKTAKTNYSLPNKTKFSIEKELLNDSHDQKINKKINVYIRYNEKHPKISVTDALDDMGQEKTRWNVFYYNKAQDFNTFKNDSNFRKSYFDRIVSKISIALFFMLPIFTLFLSLLYIRGEKNYTEHLVFVFNVQTVFFILLIVFILFDRTLNTDIGKGVFSLIFLFYLYKSLRNFYKQKRFKTIIKFLLLNFVFLILSIVGGLFISFLAFAF